MRRTGHTEQLSAAGAFALAGGLTFILGAVALFLLLRPAPSLAPSLAPPAPPTSAEYRRDVADAMAPFLTQARRMIAAESVPGSEEAKALAAKTKERLLTMTVPKEDRDAHLALVLLLDQWERAFDGSSPDAAKVGDRTEKVLERYPWLGSVPDVQAP